MIPPAKSKDRALDRLSRLGENLKARPPKSIGALLGLEGEASIAYFRAWEGMTLRWKTASRHPIPEAWHRIRPRSALRAGKPSNERAVHPLNSLLNYAYAILQSQMQIEAVAQGYDPTIGIMHNPGRRGEPALVFDLMEPQRAKVDAAVLRSAMSATFSPVDFVIRTDGTVRLMPQLARRVCQLVQLTSNNSVGLCRAVA